MKEIVSKHFKGGFRGEFRVPSDKSISHRSLLISSQIVGRTYINEILLGEDVLNTAKALKQLGVDIDDSNRQRFVVDGVGVGGLSKAKDIIDMGNSGTGARLLMGLVSSYDFNTTITGDESLKNRPMKRVTKHLQNMGVNFSYLIKEDRLPIMVHGTSNTLPITHTPEVASAQVKSAILLAGLNTAGITTVVEKIPTRDHTERMLEFFGAEIDVSGENISLKGRPYLAHKNGEAEITIPADPSSAAFLAASSLIIPNSHIVLKDVCINPLRIGFYHTLIEMGAKINFLRKRKMLGEEVADIEVFYSPNLKGITVSKQKAPSMIDEYPILAVVASFAKGETKMLGLEELRVKESDRLLAIYDGLIANGVKASIEGDNLIVRGGEVMGGGKVKTHLDHRIAMSFYIMGLASKNPITIDDTSMIATSFPNFFDYFTNRNI
jgi:3-phosphoshikimate 1-carboxyvinyltransferase